MAVPRQSVQYKFALGRVWNANRERRKTWRISDGGAVTIASVVLQSEVLIITQQWI